MDRCAGFARGFGFGSCPGRVSEAIQTNSDGGARQQQQQARRSAKAPAPWCCCSLPRAGFRAGRVFRAVFPDASVRRLQTGSGRHRNPPPDGPSRCPWPPPETEQDGGNKGEALPRQHVTGWRKHRRHKLASPLCLLSFPAKGAPVLTYARPARRWNAATGPGQRKRKCRRRGGADQGSSTVDGQIRGDVCSIILYRGHWVGLPCSVQRRSSFSPS